MIADAGRMRAYTAAMRRAIRPGSVVVDLGCGPGLFSLIAEQLGARRVFAIEPGNVIQVAREIAREHGAADRIEFIQELSTKVDLPERADVIVADLRGVLPWFGHHIPSIIDARKRLLAPGGILIPSCDKVWAAVVETATHYDQMVKPWEHDGFNLSAARNMAVNLWRKVRVEPDNLLGQPVCWYQLDYGSVEEANVCRDIALTANRRGTAHGIVMWFDAEVFDGISFSNAPGGEELIYGQAFFPFKEPVDVDAGDRIDVRFEGRSIGDDYVWRWNTTVSSEAETKISFKQSTLFGTPLSPAQLRKRANTYVPSRSEDGSIARFVLSQMDGMNSNETIATELVKRFPRRFGDVNEALDAVAEIAEKYSV